MVSQPNTNGIRLYIHIRTFTYVESLHKYREVGENLCYELDTFECFLRFIYVIEKRYAL